MADDTDSILDQQRQNVTSTAALLTTPSATAIAAGMHRPDKVFVQAITANTISVFVKNKSDVTSSGSTGGYELPPGGGIELPISTYEDFYVIAADNNQKIQVSFLGGV